MAAAWDERLRNLPCRECGGISDEAHMVICDGCELPFHPDPCANIRGMSPVHWGPWYCFRCRGTLISKGWADPIEDLALIDYLFANTLPKSDDEAARVRSLNMYRARGQELQVKI